MRYERERERERIVFYFKPKLKQNKKLVTYFTFQILPGNFLFSNSFSNYRSEKAN